MAKYSLKKIRTKKGLSKRLGKILSQLKIREAGDLRQKKLSEIHKGEMNE